MVNTIGYQRTMVAGLLTMAAGAFLFIPAAVAVSFPLFLTASGWCWPRGITGLAGGRESIRGGVEESLATASSRLDLTQAFNSLGTTVAPKIGGLLILSAAPLAIERLRQLSPQALNAYRTSEAASVKLPYAVIAVALLVLAIVIGASKFARESNMQAARIGESGPDSIWRHPNLLFGALGIFAYVGAEVSIGSFLVNYFGLPDIAGMSARDAAGYVSFYWGGAMVGRFLGAPLLRRIKAGNVLAVCATAAAGLVTISMITGGHAAMWTILGVGFFNSIMFPTIFSLGVAELGPLTGNGSGLLNMAIVGGAVLPLIQGALADRFGLHHAFVLPVICYLYIFFYALSGSMPNSERWGSAYGLPDSYWRLGAAGVEGSTRTH